MAVGPGRSGTDYLFESLRRHPEFAFPQVKEGYFYRSLRGFFRARRQAGGEAVLADVANQGYRDTHLTQHLSALRGAGVRVLVVVIIRDHVQRAQSMMLFRTSRGEPAAWLGRRLLEKRVVRDRLTAGQLEAVYSAGADVMVIDFERLVNDGGATLDRLAACCGVAPLGPWVEATPRNQASRARLMALSALGKLAAVALRRAGARRVLQRIKDSPGVRRLFFRDPAAGVTRPELSSANRLLLREENRLCWAVVARHAVLAGPEGSGAVAAAPAVDGGGLDRDFPAVSVVIPCRNASGTIAATLDSIAAQDYGGPVETIVADGSDDDRTARVIRSAHPQVRVIANPEKIASTALNRAIAASRGDVIVRCDAHAELSPEYIRRALATLEETGAANVGGRQVPAGDTLFGRAVGLAMTTALGAGDSRYKTGGPAGPVDTVYLGVFRRDALEAVGGFDLTLLRNQDYELNWRLRQSGRTVWFDPALWVLYRPRRNLRQLARQYFDYGRWKAAMLLRHPKSVRPRQLAAPALYAGLAFSAALAVAGQPWLAVVIPLAYLLALAIGSAAVGIVRRERAALLLPVALATMHLSWGLGFFLPARRLRYAAPRLSQQGDRNQDGAASGRC